MNKIRELIQWVIVAAILIFGLMFFSSKIYGAEIPTAGVITEIGEGIAEGVEEQNRLEQEQKAIEEKIEEAIKQAQIQAQLEEEQRQQEAAAEVERLAQLRASADYRLMCSIIFAEAGNQPLEGMKAVGIVVMNRVESEEWPNTVSDVIYQKGQFQPVSNGALNKALSLFDAGALEEEIHTAALYALDGNKTIEWGQTYDMSWAIYFNTHVKGASFVIQDHQFKA